eukprot:Hpha_TRINITY_DN31326_c0_g1::TRINITY_DN31326_c0_g1_i1::g.194470::m.194470
MGDDAPPGVEVEAEQPQADAQERQESQQPEDPHKAHEGGTEGGEEPAEKSGGSEEVNVDKVEVKEEGEAAADAPLPAADDDAEDAELPDASRLSTGPVQIKTVSAEGFTTTGSDTEDGDEATHKAAGGTMSTDGPGQERTSIRDIQERRRSSGAGSSRGRHRAARPPPLSIDPAQRPEDLEEEATDWVPMQSRSQGRPYYFHTDTKETVWDKPEDYEEEGDSGWVEMESRTQGRYYFYNSRTKECVWERPSGVPEPPPFERHANDPKREYLREQINAWANEFVEANGREPMEDDIPADSDIGRMHRDYAMLKDEAEYDRLKAKQTELRRELDPNSREQLREIKESLDALEPKVLKWRLQKDQERARREEVTKAYNGWIENYMKEHGRAPTEKDIPAGSDIAAMFQEYSTYREASRAAKARQARIEKKGNSGSQRDEKRLLTLMRAFEDKHGRKPTRRDLEKGSEFEKLYTDFISRMPADSPTVRQDRLMSQLSEWMKSFEKQKGRAPTTRDLEKDPEASRLQAELQQAKKLGQLKKDHDSSGRRRSFQSGPQSGSNRGTQAKKSHSRAGSAERDGWMSEDMEPDPEPTARYHSSGGGYRGERGDGSAIGCGDCCIIT